MNHRHHTSHTGHTGLESWVTEVAAHTTSDEIVWCDGSQGEWDRLTGELIRKGTFVRLNPELRPNSFLARSDPSDVARVEDSTLRGHLAGAMRGRTMYVVPFSMGRLGSPISQLGVQITYSAYVVVSMKIMTRMGKQALDLIEQSDGFVKALHSVGAPPAPGRTAGTADAVDSPIGLLPEQCALDLGGLSPAEEDLAGLLRVDPVEWQTEADSVACHFMAFDRLPPQLWDHLRRLRQGLAALPCEEPVGRRPAG